LVGDNYIDDEIRNDIGAQPSCEEVPMVQPIFEQLNIPQTSNEHVHYTPNFEPQEMEGYKLLGK